jgi:ribosomal protein S27E
MSETTMMTVPGLFIVPVRVISPCSAFSWVTVPSIGERSVVFLSSSRALSRLAVACPICSRMLLTSIVRERKSSSESS